jgi:hypothetical protein
MTTCPYCGQMMTNGYCDNPQCFEPDDEPYESADPLRYENTPYVYSQEPDDPYEGHEHVDPNRIAFRIDRTRDEQKEGI